MTAEIKRMNVKKPQTPANTKETSVAGSKGNFFSDVKAEFKKITWTDPEELKTYTKIVVGAVFVFGFGIYFADLLLQTTLNVLEYLTKVTVG